MSSFPRRAATGFEDAGLLLLIVFFIPVAILVIGAPLALIGWVVSRFIP